MGSTQKSGSRSVFPIKLAPSKHKTLKQTKVLTESDAYFSSVGYLLRGIMIEGFESSSALGNRVMWHSTAFQLEMSKMTYSMPGFQ
jgi:hypothetical protein